MEKSKLSRSDSPKWLQNMPEKPQIENLRRRFSDGNIEVQPKIKDKFRFSRRSARTSNTYSKSEKYISLPNPFKRFFTKKSSANEDKPIKSSNPRKRNWNELRNINSLKDVLGSSTALMAFLDFLKSEHSQENLEFWFSVQDFKRAASYKKAKDVFDSFIRSGAEMEINISQTMKKKIELNMHLFRENLFDEALSNILLLMEFDAFKRFQKSLEKLNS